MLLNAYCVPVPGGLSTGGDVQGRGGHGQRHCWSQKESRQPRCPHVYGIGWNDCLSVIIPFLLIFSLKCLFLNDVYDPLNHTHQGPVLDAPTGRFASRSPQQQPQRLEASAHRQLLWFRLCVFHLLTLRSELPSSYLLHKLVFFVWLLWDRCHWSGFSSSTWN